MPPIFRRSPVPREARPSYKPWIEVLESRTLLSTFLYVNNDNAPNTVSGYHVQANGDLVAVPGAPFATGGNNGFFLDPQAVTVDAVGGHVYATNGTSNTVTGFTIQADGSLVALPGGPVATPAGPVAVAADPLGRFLYVACDTGNAVRVYGIQQPTGTLTPLGSVTVANAYTLTPTPSGEFLYVQETTNTNHVFGFQVSANGTLTAVPGSPMTGPAHGGGSVVTPDGRFLYAVDGSAGKLYGYAIDPGTGQLAPLAGMPLANNFYSDLAVSPAGDLLYAGNADGSVLAYHVSATGALSAVAGSPFLNNPGASFATAFAVAPDGLQLYGVDTSSNNVSVFDIAASGALTTHTGAPYARGVGSASSVDLIASAATSVAVEAVSATADSTDQLLSLTATVTSPRGPLAGGTVTFTVAGIGTVSTGPLVNGFASAVLLLPAGTGTGTYAITATYSGTSIFDPSTGSASLLVNPAPAVQQPQPPVPPPTPPAPLAPPAPIHYLAMGADAGGGPQVKVYDAATGQLKAGFFAFPQSFTGGVRVAQADVNGDGTPDLIVGAGPGANAEVKVFDGKTGALLQDLFAWPAGSFSGGVYVAAGLFNGTPEIVVGAGPGANAEVKVFNALTGQLLCDFFGWPQGTFSGGLRVAVGDVDGDGVPDIICGAGPGAAPEIKVFSGKTGALLRDYLAFGGNFAGGIYVAAGDVDEDGQADVVAGAGAGKMPQVMVFDGSDVTRTKVLSAFFAFSQSFTGGVRVDTADVNRDGVADIIAGAGPGTSPQVNTFDGAAQNAIQSVFAFDPSFRGGVFV